MSRRTRQNIRRNDEIQGESTHQQAIDRKTPQQHKTVEAKGDFVRRQTSAIRDFSPPQNVATQTPQTTKPHDDPRSQALLRKHTLRRDMMSPKLSLFSPHLRSQQQGGALSHTSAPRSNRNMDFFELHDIAVDDDLVDASDVLHWPVGSFAEDSPSRENDDERPRRRSPRGSPRGSPLRSPFGNLGRHLQAHEAHHQAQLWGSVAGIDDTSWRSPNRSDVSLRSSPVRPDVFGETPDNVRFRPGGNPFRSPPSTKIGRSPLFQSSPTFGNLGSFGGIDTPAGHFAEDFSFDDMNFDSNLGLPVAQDPGQVGSELTAQFSPMLGSNALHVVTQTSLPVASRNQRGQSESYDAARLNNRKIPFRQPDVTPSKAIELSVDSKKQHPEGTPMTPVVPMRLEIGHNNFSIQRSLNDINSKMQRAAYQPKSFVRRHPYIQHREHTAQHYQHPGATIYRLPPPTKTPSSAITTPSAPRSSGSSTAAVARMPSMPYPPTATAVRKLPPTRYRQAQQPPPPSISEPTGTRNETNVLVSGKENAAESKSNKRTPCNCKKSKCLKLYCECFSMELFCDGCKCVDCNNTPVHKAIRDKAMKSARSKNPHAFKQRIAATHNVGCRCKRSECLKKYCECFEARVLCTSKCKCTGCMNRAGSQKLIDKRRKMKDTVGAQFAIDEAQKKWKAQVPERKPPPAPVAPRRVPMPSPSQNRHHLLGQHGSGPMPPPFPHHPLHHPHYMPHYIGHHGSMGYSPMGLPHPQVHQGYLGHLGPDRFPQPPVPVAPTPRSASKSVSLRPASTIKPKPTPPATRSISVDFKEETKTVAPTITPIASTPQSFGPLLPDEAPSASAPFATTDNEMKRDLKPVTAPIPRKKSKVDASQYFGNSVPSVNRAVAIEVLSYLCHDDLSRSSLVCKKWKELTRDEKLGSFGKFLIAGQSRSCKPSYGL